MHSSYLVVHNAYPSMSQQNGERAGSLDIRAIKEGSNLAKTKIESEPEVHFLLGIILFLGVSNHMLSSQILNFLLPNTVSRNIQGLKYPLSH